MSTGRMRRVDEAIRQVIGDAVASDLKDPRVGFVTVTDVRTSPDLRHARVYVSVLGERGAPVGAEQREASLDGLRSAHGFLQGRIAGELRLKRTPTLEFVYDDTTDRAMRVEELLDEIGAVVSDAQDATQATPRAGAREHPRGLALRARHARAPRRRRARLARRDAGAADARSARTRSCSSRPTTCRCPREYRLFALDGADPRAAGRHRRAHRRVPRLRQHRPQLRRACCATARTC